jgi:AcrR family transcriptional regulator
MSPRPYNLGKRQEQISQGRRQILDATRSLLGEATSYTDFTVDAVARRATVYYQFGSKTGLLEALCDDLAEAGHLSDLALAFSQPDNAQALRGFVACFARLWDADRAVMRRLRALAALDAEVGAVIAARDQRRSEGLTVLVARFAGSGPGGQPERCVRILHALTSFETFDALAPRDRPVLDVVPDVIALAEATLRELDNGGPTPD